MLAISKGRSGSKGISWLAASPETHLDALLLLTILMDKWKYFYLFTGYVRNDLSLKATKLHLQVSNKPVSNSSIWDKMYWLTA